jgi:hypothetical protein
MVGGEGLIRTALAKPADKPIEVPGRAIRLGNGNGHAFPDDLGVIDAGVFGKKIQIELEETRYPF